MTHSGDRENLPRFAELDGDYEILRELGRGGTAVVYLAHERVLSRLVAIKVIRSTYVEDEEAVARLMREARTVGGMQHPNIVVLYGTRRLGDGSLALIMQYIPGRTLRKEIQACGGLPFERVHRILTDVGRALAHAHRQSIVHRDVKPENIYVDEESGLARLSDFGIARAWDVESELTLPGTAIGTPAYMSPEQIDGGVVDGRSDLFSLGLVGYEMLTGTRPWAGESLYSVIAKQKNTQLPALKERRPGIPAALQLAIEGALRKDRNARWQTANEFLTALGSPPEPERAEEPASPFAQLISVEQTPSSAAAAPAAGPGTSHRDNDTVVWRPPVAPPPPTTLVTPPTPEFVTSETIITPPPVAAKARKPRASGRRRAMLIGAGALVVLTLATAAVSMTTTGQDSAETTIADDDVLPAAPVPASDAEPAPPPAAEITEDAPPPPADVAPHSVSARAALLYSVFGDAQQGPAGVTLAKPLMVRVVDAAGRSVEGATVHFTVTTGAGSVKPTMALTNRDGVAATRWLPRTVGVHRAQARVDGLDGVIAFSARALPGPKASPRRSNVARREPVRPPVQRRAPAATTPRSTRPTTGPGNTVRSTTVPSALGAVPMGLTVRREVAAGGRHSCTLDGTGIAICWGSAEAGQLGGRPVGPAAAVRVTTAEPFTTLVAGATHTCAIAASGRAFCWGGNGSGQLGDGTRVSRAIPERVRLTDRLTSITVGLQHTCAIDTTGQISCWGQNNRGQLGDRTKADRALAVRVAGRGTFRSVSAGWTHTCGVGTDGTAYCWGSNRFGELGDPDGSDHAVPTAVAGGHRFSSIAAGNGFSCGLRTDGAVLCWGDNTHGQLGNGATSLSVMPVEILAATRFTDIAAGAAHACAISWDGTAYCWGQNDYGQLGDGTTQDRRSPTAVTGGHRFSAISASAAHSCATATNGRSLCWGSNRDGQVGDVPRNVQTRPVPSAH